MVWWVGAARRHIYSNTKAAAIRSIQKQRQQGQIRIYQATECTILCCGGVSSLRCHFTPNGACAGIPRTEHLPLFCLYGLDCTTLGLSPRLFFLVIAFEPSFLLPISIYGRTPLNESLDVAVIVNSLDKRPMPTCARAPQCIFSL
jgi:hypothetical protein